MFLCVTAKESAAKPATGATQVRLRLDVFDQRTEELGAATDAARAELIDVDRVTMWRYRTGRLTPSLDKAMAIAAQLGITVEELIEQVSA